MTTDMEIFRNRLGQTLFSFGASLGIKGLGENVRIYLNPLDDYDYSLIKEINKISLLRRTSCSCRDLDHERFCIITMLIKGNDESCLKIANIMKEAMVPYLKNPVSSRERIEIKQSLESTREFLQSTTLQLSKSGLSEDLAKKQLSESFLNLINNILELLHSPSAIPADTLMNEGLTTSSRHKRMFPENLTNVSIGRNVKIPRKSMSDSQFPVMPANRPSALIDQLFVSTSVIPAEAQAPKLESANIPRKSMSDSQFPVMPVNWPSALIDQLFVSTSVISAEAQAPKLESANIFQDKIDIEIFKNSSNQTLFFSYGSHATLSFYFLGVKDLSQNVDLKEKIEGPLKEMVLEIILLRKYSSDRSELDEKLFGIINLLIEDGRESYLKIADTMKEAMLPYLKNQADSHKPENVKKNLEKVRKHWETGSHQDCLKFIDSILNLLNSLPAIFTEAQVTNNDTSLRIPSSLSHPHLLSRQPHPNHIIPSLCLLEDLRPSELRKSVEGVVSAVPPCFYMTEEEVVAVAPSRPYKRDIFKNSSGQTLVISGDPNSEYWLRIEGLVQEIKLLFKDDASLIKVCDEILYLIVLNDQQKLVQKRFSLINVLIHEGCESCLEIPDIMKEEMTPYLKNQIDSHECDSVEQTLEIARKSSCLEIADIMKEAMFPYLKNQIDSHEYDSVKQILETARKSLQFGFLQFSKRLIKSDFDKARYEMSSYEKRMEHINNILEFLNRLSLNRLSAILTRTKAIPRTVEKYPFWMRQP